MKSGKFEKKKSRSILPALIIVGVMALSFAGGYLLGSRGTAEIPENTPGTTAAQPEETTTAPSETTLPQQSEGSWLAVTDTQVVVTTPYGPVCYDAKFAEFLRITNEFDLEQYTVRFDADLGTGETLNVFSVCFAVDNGRQPEGTYCGSVTDEDGRERLVIVTANAALTGGEWDADTENLIYAMLESVSGCIDQLNRDYPA